MLSSPNRVAAMLDELEPAEREVVQRLAAGPPIGTVGDALLPVDRASDATSPRRLIARGLLIPVDMQTVELPREVGLVVRGAGPLVRCRRIRRQFRPSTAHQESWIDWGHRGARHGASRRDARCRVDPSARASAARGRDRVREFACGPDPRCR